MKQIKGKGEGIEAQLKAKPIKCAQTTAYLVLVVQLFASSWRLQPLRECCAGQKAPWGSLSLSHLYHSG